MLLMIRLFLTALLLALTGPASAASFCVHKNNVVQTGFTVQTYNQLTGWVERYDEGGRFASDVWTPVGTGEDARPVTFVGQVWILKALGYLGGVPNYVVRIIKNGTPLDGTTLAADIATPGYFANTAVVTVAQMDIAEPGDAYRIYLYVTNADAEVDAHPLGHTFWCGTTDD